MDLIGTGSCRIYNPKRTYSKFKNKLFLLIFWHGFVKNRGYIIFCDINKNLCRFFILIYPGVSRLTFLCRSTSSSSDTSIISTGSSSRVRFDSLLTDINVDIGAPLIKKICSEMAIDNLIVMSYFYLGSTVVTSVLSRLKRSVVKTSSWKIHYDDKIWITKYLLNGYLYE